jgi:hypothetical protein
VIRVERRDGVYRLREAANIVGIEPLYLEPTAMDGTA